MGRADDQVVLTLNRRNDKRLTNSAFQRKYRPKNAKIIN